MSNSTFSNRTSIPALYESAMSSSTTIPATIPATTGTAPASDPEKGNPTELTVFPGKIIRGGGIKALFGSNGALAPFRLLKSDLKGRSKVYHTDWFFNQLILASAVFVFFTNLLPGITFASDLYVLTGKNYGTIEVVFSTGLCGVIFAL